MDLGMQGSEDKQMVEWVGMCGGLERGMEGSRLREGRKEDAGSGEGNVDYSREASFERRWEV